MEKIYGAYELSDINHDLIHLYGRLVQEGEPFINRVERLFEADPGLTLYMERRKEFNELGPATQDTPERAALFVWLNKHAFNGICRYNSSGGFNVPWNQVIRKEAKNRKGQIMGKPSCPSEAMMNFHTRSASTKVSFMQRNFVDALAQAKEGDMVYCDPPYLPLNAAGFTSYAKEGFGLDDHRLLANMACEAAGRGAVVAISNHAIDTASELYKSASRIERTDVRRSVGASGESRGKVGELLAIWDRK